MKDWSKRSFALRMLVIFALVVQLAGFFPAQAAGNGLDSGGSTIKEALIHTYDQNTWAFSTLAKGPNGEVYLAHKVSGSEIAVKKWGGNGWVSVKNITTSMTGDTRFSDSLDLAVDADGKLHLVFKHEEGSWIDSRRGVKYGVYDGQGWTFTEVEAYSDSQGWKNFYTPSLAVDSNGKAHITYIYDYAETHTHYLKYASNATGTWKVDILIQSSGGVDEIHKPDIAVDKSDKVHLAYVKEDNQNDYYGNYYYTSKQASAADFPPAQKLVDAVSENKNYLYTPMVVDNLGKVHFAYYLHYGSLNNLQSSTAYIQSNISGGWKREALYTESNRILFSLRLYADGSDIYGLGESWSPDWSEGYFVALAKNGNSWFVGNKTVKPELVTDYADEWTYLIDDQGNFVMVLLHGDLKKLSSLLGTKADFGLAPPANVYKVSYDGNGNTGGTVPIDTNGYQAGSSAVALDNKGNLVKSGYRFVGWNTKADGTGIDYSPGAAVPIDNNSVTLFAKWVPELSDEARLSDLTISQGTLSPAFASGTTDYTADVGNKVPSITVTPTAAHNKATVTVNGVVTASGQGTSVPLQLGANMITIIVTAEDGATTKTYTLKVTRVKSSNNDLSDIAVSKGELAPRFSSSITAYTVTVSNDMDSIDLTPTIADDTAVLTVNGRQATSGAPASLPLTIGTNTASIKVIAQNGEEKTYEVVVTREALSDEELAQKDKDSLAIGYASGDSEASVTQNVSLPDAGEQGSVITWASSHSGYLSHEGVVTRPKFTDGEQTVKLTATIQKGHVVLEKDFTLKLPALEGHTVLYDANGANAGEAPKMEKYNPGQTATAADNTASLSKIGYTFTGWNTKADGTGTSYKAGDEFTIHHNLILYAQWKINQYTVIFDSGGGTPVQPEAVNHGEQVSKPADPAKKGYTFRGWYKDEQLVHPFNFDAGITESITLYARWSADGGGSVPPPASVTEEIIVDVVSGDRLLVQTPIKRTTASDGTVTDDVTFTKEKAEEAVDQLNKLPNKTATIMIPDVNDRVAETMVTIPQLATKALASEKVNLEIQLENVRLFVPSGSLAGLGKDLFFRVVPVRSETGKKEVEERAKQEKIVKEITVGKTETIKVLGQPMKIETNLQNRPVSLKLPLPANLSETITDNRAVFIEHSDGTKEVVQGRKEEFKPGKQSVAFSIQKFSTFTVLYMEGAAEYFAAKHAGAHKMYIHGFKDGTFRPDDTVTRAQTAAMLMRNLDINYKGTSSYTDTKGSFAFKEIEMARQADLILGFKDGTFRPKQPVTRAQVAVIASRWVNKMCKGETDSAMCHPAKPAVNFNDVPADHWAANAISHASKLGIVNGFNNGSFKPEQPIIRAQMVVMLNRLFDRGPLNGVNKQTFKDAGMDHWAFKEIEEAATNHRYKISEDGKEILVP